MPMPRLASKLFCACALALALGGAFSVEAATRTWTGAGGTRLLSNAANWQGNVVPAAGDRLAFSISTPTALEIDLPNASFDGLDVQGASPLQVIGMPVTFTSATPFNISGADFVLVTDTRLATAATIAISGANARFYVNVAGTLRMNGTITFNMATSESVRLDGNLVEEAPTSWVFNGGRDVSIDSASTISGTITSSAADLYAVGNVGLATGGTRMEGSARLHMSAPPGGGTFGKPLDLRSTVSSSQDIANFYSNGQGPFTFAGAVNLTGTQYLKADIPTTFAGPIGGPGSLYIAYGGGTVTLTNHANSITGVTVSSLATLHLGAAEVISDSGTLYVNYGGTLILDSGVETVDEFHCLGAMQVRLGDARIHSTRVVEAGCPLTITAPAAFTPAPGTAYTIVEYTGPNEIVNIFPGLPEGAVVNLAGYRMTATYRAAPSGKSFALVATPASTPTPARATISSGDSQVVAPGGVPARDLVVFAIDGVGSAAANTRVTLQSFCGTFAGGTNAAGASTVEVTTNAAGLATSPTFTLGTGTASPCFIAVWPTVVGSSNAAAFTIHVVDPATLTITATPSPIPAVLNQGFLFTLRVAAPTGTFIEAMPIALSTVPAASGANASVPSAVIVTAAGTADVRATANDRAGDYTIVARFGGRSWNLPVHQVGAASATAYSLASGEIVATTYEPVLIRVKVTSGLASDPPLPGIPVTFSVDNVAGANAIVGLTPTVGTDANGIAVGTLQANDRVGSYVVHVSTPGGSISIPVRNVPRTSLSSAIAGSPVMVRVSDGGSECTIASFGSDSIGESNAIAPAGALPAGRSPQFGLQSVWVQHCAADVAITLEYATATPTDAQAWIWAGPTEASRAWQQVPATFSGSTMRVVLHDGDALDDDHAVNGEIRTRYIALLTSSATYQDMWWSGTVENGWGMSVVQHRDVLFAVVYGYDATGRPEWYVMPGGSWNSAKTVYSGLLYIPQGTPFYAYDTAHFKVGAAVGAATLSFRDNDAATLELSINGAFIRKSITRMRFGEGGSTSLALGDMWWGGMSQNGWGISVLQQDATLFSVWYTYDATGRVMWYVMPGGHWTSANTYEGRIYRTTGSPLGTYDASRLQVIDVGAYALRFTDNSASLEYSIEGRTGTVPLSRQPF